MLNKIGEAIHLLSSNFLLFSSIILTVWLPGNLLLNSLVYFFGREEFIEMGLGIEIIFGPIYIGAMLYALSCLKQGHHVSYSEAMTVGFRKWGSLFAARFVAGIFIGLGLIFLVVPGIILYVRYALVNSAVVFEGVGTTESRSRSAELTIGARWQIFGAAAIYFIGFEFYAILVENFFEFVEQLNTMFVWVILDCFTSIAYAFIQIVMFLFYWKARERHDGINESVTPSGEERQCPMCGEVIPAEARECQFCGEVLPFILTIR